MKNTYKLLILSFVTLLFMGQSCDIPSENNVEDKLILDETNSIEQLPTAIEGKVDLIENIEESAQDNNILPQNLPIETEMLPTEPETPQAPAEEDTPTEQGNTVVGGQTCGQYVAGVKQDWQCEKIQWCGTSLNVCHDEAYCLNHSDCDSGVCTSGYCLGGANSALPEHSPCKNNAQCISGKLCVDGGCVPAEEVLLPDEPQENAPCENNAQCISGKLCQDGSCVPAEDVLLPDEPQENSPCSNDAQCISGKVCQNNECVLDSE